MSVRPHPEPDTAVRPHPEPDTAVRKKPKPDTGGLPAFIPHAIADTIRQ